MEISRDGENSEKIETWNSRKKPNPEIFNRMFINLHADINTNTF